METTARARIGAIAAAALIAGTVAACGGDEDEEGGTTTTQAASGGSADAGPDRTALPLGDDKVSDSPRRGYVYLCRTDSPGGGGAAVEGPWIDREAGTWNAEQKVSVPGAVNWPGEFRTQLRGDTRSITGNDLPDHPTGTFPIPSDSKAYTYDRNPNEVASQTVALELPAVPQPAAEPACMGGEAGIALSGVAIFNGFDAETRDANAHEVQDSCQGHPQIQSVYHYHSISDCLGDNESGDGHSPLLGYALDGFGIYGHHGTDGEILTNADLDECHGHTHEIDWDGETRSLHHYHATFEFPYVVGCFRAEPAATMVVEGTGAATEGGAPPGAPPGDGPPAGGPPPPP